MTDGDLAVVGALDLLQDFLQAGFVGAVVVDDQQAGFGAVGDIGELVGGGVVDGAAGSPRPGDLSHILSCNDVSL